MLARSLLAPAHPVTQYHEVIALAASIVQAERCESSACYFV